ncbi:MAG: hypothetical protein C4K58_07155, partial [Flavobacteriaceae bacterium]
MVLIKTRPNNLHFMNEKQTVVKEKSTKKPIYKTLLGVIFLVVSLFLFLSFLSNLWSWKQDQSQVESLTDVSIVAENWMGKLGALISYSLMNHGVGIMAFLVSAGLFCIGVGFFNRKGFVWFVKGLLQTMFFFIWIPLVLAYFFQSPILSGIFGVEINDFLLSLFNPVGTAIFLFTLLVLYLIVKLKISPSDIYTPGGKRSTEPISDPDLTIQSEDLDIDKGNTPQEESITLLEKTQIQKESPKDPFMPLTDVSLEDLQPKENSLKINHSFELDSKLSLNPSKKVMEEEIIAPEELDEKAEVSLNVAKVLEEEQITGKQVNRVLEEFGQYDPRLDLKGFTFPTLDLLIDYNKDKSVVVDTVELERNKNRIVETLNQYGIGIAKINATIGPTVTLYEIVPEAGNRISKIKNLEDDIALSLSALGIRIIAPIPGKGTIGIEVPNSNPTVVPMRGVIASKKFQECDMELPIAFGKTISNETFVADLAKMPHLLMAGATGQGKSVGLNAIITSLLYKKHPSELKFVLVDPKKVELTLYNKIERHYLAKLPDSEEAIITDNNKVINTLNSLCIEMDQRYEMLKLAMVRNIKEYNTKFKERKLNPENGHAFLPYIVLVVDEFADLIMTAGKEVELPIARLAQLARAVGIHLIVATQRPSVNVITGIIKANFPARVAFRVTSKIDSRTILDASGADQLIGKGELVAMKASGMSLTRIFQPLFILVVLMSIGLYFFSDQVVPLSQRKSKNMIFNIIRSKPTLNFSEGIFIDGIPSFSMRIGKKTSEDGKDLKDVFIHKKASSGEDQLTIIAKNGRLAPSANKNFLRLDLFSGVYYQDDVATVNYQDRQKQQNKIIKFDTLVQYFDVSELINSAIEKETVTNYYLFMDNKTLAAHIDSTINTRTQENKQLQERTYDKIINSFKKNNPSLATDLYKIKLDTLDKNTKTQMGRASINEIQYLQSSLIENRNTMNETNKLIAKQQIHLHKTFSFSLICVVFFLIGGSLGSIIRKGGIGLPIVMATVVFVLFYLITYTSESLAKAGNLSPVLAAWSGVIVLFPLSLFLFYKAKMESSLFNIDQYIEPIMGFFRKFVKPKEEHT